MKRLVGLISIALLCAGILPARSRLILTVHGNYFSLAQNKLTSQSGDKKFYAEGKAAVTISRNLYLWGSYGFLRLSDDWTTWNDKNSYEKDLHVYRDLDKTIVSWGFGYYVGYLHQSELGIRVEIGACRIHNGIDASYRWISDDQQLKLDTAKQAAFGGRASLGFTYGLFGNVFAELSIGYLLAPDKTNDLKSNLGGLNLSLGLGIQL